jgi:WD40 repeat protein
VSALAFSPQQPLLATGGGALDPAIRLWSLAGGPLLFTLAGHASGVGALAFSPDGALARTLTELASPVNSVTFAAGGNLLVAAGPRAIKLWKTADGTLAGSLERETCQVNSLAVSPNGNLLVFAREDTTLALTPSPLAPGQPPLRFIAATSGLAGLSLVAAVQPNYRYLLQTSTNLTDWLTLTNVPATSTVLRVSDPGAYGVAPAILPRPDPALNSADRHGITHHSSSLCHARAAGAARFPSQFS